MMTNFIILPYIGSSSSIHYAYNITIFANFSQFLAKIYSIRLIHAVFIFEVCMYDYMHVGLLTHFNHD